MKLFECKEIKKSIIKDNKIMSIPKKIAIATVIASLTLFLGCDSLLDVSNPNSLTEEDVTQPSAANGLKNGTLNSLMIGTAWTYAATSTISDELRWTGSYESYKTFDEGRINFPSNEIIVQGFPEISEARYMADISIENITRFDSEGTLEDRSILARTYIYSAVIRITIADSYENFVFSAGMEAMPAIGEENMYQLYDQAIDHATEALNVSTEIENTTLQAQALGIRARAKHAKGIWELLNPAGSTPSDPIVRGTGASADAQAALDLMPSDYKATFDYQSALLTNYMATQVIQRRELTFNEPFNDLKTGDTDPRAEAIINDFMDTSTYTELYPPFTWLSAREMHLIIAEEAIGVNDSEARATMNDVRAMNGLPGIEPGDDLVQFIEHERRANLHFQNRRLNDMYRFGSQSDNWLPNEDAIQRPGTLLPISSNETLANPNL